MSLIYEGFETPQLSEYIDNSLAKRLIQEINFKYGLKVISYIPPDTRLYAPRESFLVGDANGMTVAKVWVDKEDGVDVYNYRSPFYRKDRGSDSADRETIHSKKLSTLMATLKRNNVVPSGDGILNRIGKEVFSAGVSQLESHHGNTYKQYRLDVEDVHDLLRAVIGETPNTLDIEKCKKELDKLNQIDRIVIEKREDVERFFFNEFYAIGADKLNHLVIGSVKAMPRQGHDDYKFEVVKPFKRMKEMPDEFKAITLMNKVYAEGKDVNKFYANIIPALSGYNPDLDLVNIATRVVDEFNCQWTLVPCSGL